ncbi:hypothetical protein A3F08_02280 [Candidatus Berkelbacteria bacterium RIFCSPHIGHO2_12_FULL_36_9]|uniref:Uncharacterized protein n=1 Tax=Candidatus Berkelbacteria bacterium RIFCSPHIGHO2_12_FULL_36_9 TaxID=1797469 RepID=A0A1F5EGM5_9BACT|nr:MAG: hypothetical protein A3F08_02280 [Candidatus Berkelbacteria bacterium RIFCSPHIGHO2_12_FULL_36_9]
MRTFVSSSSRRTLTKSGIDILKLILTGCNPTFNQNFLKEGMSIEELAKIYPSASKTLKLYLDCASQMWDTRVILAFAAPTHLQVIREKFPKLDLDSDMEVGGQIISFAQFLFCHILIPIEVFPDGTCAFHGVDDERTFIRVKGIDPLKKSIGKYIFVHYGIIFPQCRKHPSERRVIISLQNDGLFRDVLKVIKEKNSNVVDYSFTRITSSNLTSDVR